MGPVEGKVAFITGVGRGRLKWRLPLRSMMIRCIGSNFARTVSKAMLTAVLDRMPDYRCQPEGTVHYDTIGVIQGMRHLPATFTPGRRFGTGLDGTLDKLQTLCDEQQLTRPITELKESARTPG